MIRLEKMGAADFAAFNEINIKLLAEALKEECSPEEARQKAEAEQREVLPDSEKTSGQYIFAIKSTEHSGKEYAESGTAGGLWFTPLNRDSNNFAFLFFIHLSSELRSKGIGSRAMELLEEEAKKLNLPAIRLHVFKSNTAAVGVYEKLGYRLFTNYKNYTEDNPGMIMEKSFEQIEKPFLTIQP